MFLNILQYVKEVLNIRKIQPVEIQMHLPTTEEGMRELSRRVASVHVDAVDYIVKSMSCPTSQKMAVIDALINMVKQRSREQI